MYHLTVWQTIESSASWSLYYVALAGILACIIALNLRCADAGAGSINKAPRVVSPGHVMEIIIIYAIMVIIVMFAMLLYYADNPLKNKKHVLISEEVILKEHRQYIEPISEVLRSSQNVSVDIVISHRNKIDDVMAVIKNTPIHSALNNFLVFDKNESFTQNLAAIFSDSSLDFLKDDTTLVLADNDEKLDKYLTVFDISDEKNNAYKLFLTIHDMKPNKKDLDKIGDNRVIKTDESKPNAVNTLGGEVVRIRKEIRHGNP